MAIPTRVDGMNSASHRFVPQTCSTSGRRAPVRMSFRRSQRSLVRRDRGVVSIAASSSGADNSSFGLTPSQPKTAFGEMMEYYLKMQPQLFRTAVEDQLEKIQEERREVSEEEDRGGNAAEAEDSTEMVLFRRMKEVKLGEISAKVEDLMYVCVLEKFIEVGVPMLGRMEGMLDHEVVSLKPLLDGLHSKEAIEMVREHVLSVMGAATQVPSLSPVKISKLQMAQVYIASIMFGYFLRQVDRRFQLDRSLGMLAGDDTMDDAVARLERLFSVAEDAAGSDDPDAPQQVDAKASAAAEAGEESGSDSLVKKKGSVLRQYVNNFDQKTMLELARMVSQEGAGLVERQTTALFGDLKELQTQMQDLVTKDGPAMSYEELMERVQNAVMRDDVATVMMTVGTQRRAVLEAVAFGTFLRDVETWVSTDYEVLSPLPKTHNPGMGGAEGGPGFGGFGGGGASA